jgi:hypothetical protein
MKSDLMSLYCILYAILSLMSLLLSVESISFTDSRDAEARRIKDKRNMKPII